VLVNSQASSREPFLRRLRKPFSRKKTAAKKKTAKQKLQRTLTRALALAAFSYACAASASTVAPPAAGLFENFCAQPLQTIGQAVGGSDVCRELLAP